MKIKNLKKLALISILMFIAILMLGEKQTNASGERYIGINDWRYVDDSQNETIIYAIGNPAAQSNPGVKIVDIATYDDIAGNNMSTGGNLYCARAEVGTSAIKKYDLSYDLVAQKDAIMSSSKSHLEGVKAKYYNLLALSDLLYIEDSTTEASIVQYEKQMGISADDYDVHLNINDLRAVQQAAIWYYTNYDSSLYTDIYSGIVDSSVTAWLFQSKNGGTSYSAISNQWNGELERKEQADALFVSLIEQADANANKYKPTSEGGQDKVPNKTITLYTTSLNDEYAQPIIDIEKRFDLALRKYITSINGTAPTNSRIPQVDTSKINRKIGGVVRTTATYNHPKNQLTVSTNDTVIYTLRVYNEGSSAGYAGIIKDYLPEGLDFVELVDATGRYTASASADGRTVTITNVARTKIPAYTTSIQYDEVKVKCRVSKQKSASREVLTNIAEIAQYVDGDTVVSTDRDSEPQNFPSSLKTNSYEGNGTNGEDTNYILGQQDDDDFEPLVLEPATGSYKLKILKTDKDDATKKLQNAKFKVKLNNGAETEITTGTNGEAEYGTINITETGTDTITINETQAPGGYNQIIGALTLKVTKGLESGAFKATNQTLEGQINSAAEASLSGDTITVTVKDQKKVFDLALRKFITAKNGTAISDREPNITAEDITGLKNKDTSKTFDGTTAYKRHTKTPLTVATGDKITYTIRIYNEGEVDGTASVITDYLPEGLELVPASESTINTTYGWTADASNSKKITTNYLNGRNIAAFNGTTISTDEVKVECKVTAAAGASDTSLKNVAEITESKNAYNYQDRDSTNLLTDNQKNNYNPGTSTDGKGYEDDDDYEPLVLPKAEGNYKLKIVKTDKDDTTKKLQNAKFKVKVNNGAETEITTGTNGEAEYGTINITATGTDTITINETQAPGGYNQIIGALTLKVTKGIESGVYKVTGQTLEGQINSAAEASLSGDTITVTVKDQKKVFDLALRKFITAKNGTAISDREPNITAEDITGLKNKDTSKTFDGTTAYKRHTKTPLTVATEDKITFTIRIYNEGEVDGTASIITDYLPEGLELVPASESTINTTYGWTADASNSKKITTNYLNGKTIVAFNGTTLSYDEVKVECKVTATAGTTGIKNVAEITESKNPYNYPDRDNTNPLTDEQKNNYNPGTSTDGKGYEDDDDFEPINIEAPQPIFDLALRKFAVSKNGTDITPSREPVINETELAKLQNRTATFDDGTTAEKGHTKSALSVLPGDKIIYAIRVYNEGEIDGEATEIVDYLPTGLELVPASESETNATYGWVAGENNAIKTTYLTGQTISAFDGNTLSYKDVYIECKVTAQITANKQSLKNVAEITKSTNPEGISDEDSTPDNVEKKGDEYNPGDSERGKGYEDDDDFENLVVEDVTGKYKIQLYKQDENGNTIRSPEAKFKINNEEKTTTNGELILDDISILEEGTDTYTIEETEAPEGYKRIIGTITLNVSKVLNDNKDGYIATGSLAGTDENVSIENSNNTITIKVKNKKKFFDLALRKYITKIDGTPLANTDSRNPQINTNSLNNGTTATYNHRKDPVTVKQGSVVTYNLTVYNEGEKAGRATKIIDILPTGLTYSKINTPGFTVDYNTKGENTIIITRNADNQTNLDAYTANNLKSETIEIECIVTAKPDTKNQKILTNIAWIAEEYNAVDNETITNQSGADRDSEPSTVPAINNDNMADYKGDTNNKSVTPGDSNYHYKGQQDDDDFEKLVIEPTPFDLALRKFITKVEETTVTSRIPEVSYDETSKKITYNHSKEPVEVKNGSTVIYTLRVYNEGQANGYASEISDDVPKGLEFLPENDTNKEYRWVMYDSEGNVTTDSSKAVKIKTDYLSKEQGEARMAADSSLTENPALLKAFDSSKPITVNNPDYADVKIAFKVTEPSKSGRIVINSAQISDDTDEDGNPVDDTDSETDKWNDGEDDQDQEFIKLIYFDLALRKYITKVNDKDVTNRNPQVSYDETNNKITYNHTKEPVEVANSDTIIYTIRVYNEGTMDGYASEVSDDLPEGLEYLPDNEVNKEYRWVMFDKDGKETTNIKNAVRIKTDYLSKEQGEARMKNDSKLTENPALLKAFDSSKGITDDNPDYADVKIAFKVTEPAKSERILINSAQISDDTDEDGNPVDDVDSETDKWNDGEDDQDQEKVKLTYFDLSLRKWVTQAIVVENGKQTISETGHKAEDNPEGIVKVEIKNKKLNEVTVKFRYSIRITNEGKIAGYAKEITDYVPQGLKFIAEDNPGWTDKGNNVITTRLLENTLLQPGQSAEVSVVLTWINGGNNLGLKTNIAEISEDYNEKGIPDIDSTPNNKVTGEDDIDDAPVLLSISTGSIKTYAVLGLVILVTIGSGIVLIKRFVL